MIKIIYKFTAYLRNPLLIPLVLAFQFGCTTLPDIEADIRPVQAPTIVNARGELPAGTSKAIINSMQRKAGPTDILRYHLAYEEQITDSPLVAGNRVTLLNDGPATYAAIFKAMDAARDHINLETYIFEDDEIGAKFVDALLKKQAEGVQVNIIYDAVGTLSTPNEFFERLRRSGIATLKFNPINPLQAKSRWSLNRRDHRKILVVDGKVAFTGGVNISNVYSRSSRSSSGSSGRITDTKKAAWRDTHVQIEGPAVAEFQKLFLDTWRRKNGEALAERVYFPQLTSQGDHVVRVIGSTPETASFDIYQTFLSAITHADHSIYLTNAYFVPDERILSAIKQAAEKGIDVKIILPSFTDSGAVFHAGRYYYTTLLQSGVKIYERRNAMLHAKTAVIDGVWSTVGSTNFDLRSFLHNDEVNAIILGTEFSRRLEALFEEDLRQSDEIKLEDWKRRPFMLRLKEGAANLIKYWL